MSVRVSRSGAIATVRFRHPARGRGGRPTPDAGLFEALRLVSGLARSDELHHGLRAYRGWLETRLARLDEPGSFAASIEQLDRAERDWAVPR